MDPVTASESLGAALALTASLASSIAYARAHHGGGKRDPREPQPGSLPAFRLVHGLVQIVVPLAALALLAGRRDLALAWPVHPAVTVAGILLAIAGFALFVAAKATLGPHYAPCFDARVPTAIVDRGPYARIRHPIYTANVVALSGLTAATGSGWIALCTVLVAAAYAVSAVREERALQAINPAYAAYMARTGRFLPGL